MRVLREHGGWWAHKEFALIAFGSLQNGVDASPRLRMLLERCHERIDLLALRIISARVHRHDDLTEGVHGEGKTWRGR